MLFTIIKVGLKGRSFYKNPQNFVEEGVTETALSFLILPAIFCFLFLVLLFVLGFTGLIGGPFLLAKIFFWIVLIISSIIAVPVYFFYKLVKKVSRKAGSTTEKLFVKAEVKE
jgi:uncharacterized RDD family membrane protein YckC